MLLLRENNMKWYDMLLEASTIKPTRQTQNVPNNVVGYARRLWYRDADMENGTPNPGTRPIGITINGKYTPYNPKNPEHSAIAQKQTGKKDIQTRFNPEEYSRMLQTAKMQRQRRATKNPHYQKNKKLNQDINPSHLPAFTEAAVQPDAEFYKKFNKYQIGAHSFRFTESMRKTLGEIRFPKSYIQIAERLLSMRVGDKTMKITNFDPSLRRTGAGIITSQAGEILYMMGMTLSDDTFDKFFKEIERHIGHSEQFLTGKRIVDQKWLNTVKKQRKITLQHIKKKYGKDAKITHASWDNENEVEALGLSDYYINKGSSTDVYVRVNTPQGDMLEEVSLKKDHASFLYAGNLNFKSAEEGEVDVDDYRRTLNKSYLSFISQHQNIIDPLLQKPNKKLQKEIKNWVPGSRTIHDVISSKNYVNRNRLIKSLITSLAESGNDDAIAFINNIKETQKSFIEHTYYSLVSNEKLKSELMDNIHQNFSLHSAITDEEALIIGDVVVNKDVLFELFETTDPADLKERVYVDVSGAFPLLMYETKSSHRQIPVAKISIREYGTLYSGRFLFSMVIAPQFYKLIKEINNKLFPEKVDD